MKAADWVLARPWAITEEALGVILSIAERRNESPEAVEAKLGRPLDNAHKVSVRDGVAIVPVVGPISRYADFFTEISGATSIETLAKDFRTCLDDRSIKAIVLNVDSPGGTVAGVSEFATHVRDARGTKPIVAYVGSQAASAGYWIASAADQVVADSTAMLGSIGVVMGMPRKKATDPIEIVSSQSPYKRVDATTETGKAHVQATADDLAGLFVNAVAMNRDVPRDKVLSDFGQGGCFVASKAVAAGMADGLGSLESVIACLSRGEMPCPSSPKKKPAAKADNPPRRAAMSEPIETISAAEAAELRKQLADAKQATADAEARHKAEAQARLAAVEEAIGARADAFVSEFVGAANRTQYAVGLRETFVLAARDDHANPVAGSKTHRQDKLRETLKGRPAPTKETISADPEQESRALAADPAGEPKARADADRQKRRERNQAAARKQNARAAAE